MTLRSFIFWPHLIAGVLAGVVILIMSATGVLLMYERQMIAFSERHYRSTPPAAGATLSVEAIGAALKETHPDLEPTGFTIHADSEAAVIVAAGRRTFAVDAYSGRVLGETSGSGVRRTLSTIREWHRWLAVGGENRAFARAVTGWSNALFLFIVISGFYIWFPRKWTRAGVRAVTLFNPRLSGKARDFNWHNVIGVWSFVPLFFVVITAMPISFPWAGALIFRAVGETPPTPPPAAERARRGAEARSAGRERDREPVSLAGLDALWARAAQQEAGWRTIAIRVTGSAKEPVAFTIDRGDGGQPHLRSTLTLDRRSGDVVRWETFAGQSLGRRLRSLARFTHTGESLGLVGQTIAGLVSAGAVVLVWTGLALAWRRFRAWLKRRTAAEPIADEQTPRTTAA